MKANRNKQGTKALAHTERTMNKFQKQMEERRREKKAQIIVKENESQFQKGYEEFFPGAKPSSNSPQFVAGWLRAKFEHESEPDDIYEKGPCPYCGAERN